MSIKNKHKQALNNLSAVIATRKYDKELTKEYIKILNDLINCQLTLKEINYTICWLEESLSELEEGYIRNILEGIITKLKDQKTMWEVE